MNRQEALQEFGWEVVEVAEEEFDGDFWLDLDWNQQRELFYQTRQMLEERDS